MGCADLHSDYNQNNQISFTGKTFPVEIHDQIRYDGREIFSYHLEDRMKKKAFDKKKKHYFNRDEEFDEEYYEEEED